MKSIADYKETVRPSIFRDLFIVNNDLCLLHIINGANEGTSSLIIFLVPYMFLTWVLGWLWGQCEGNLSSGCRDERRAHLIVINPGCCSLDWFGLEKVVCEGNFGLSDSESN